MAAPAITHARGHGSAGGDAISLVGMVLFCTTRTVCDPITSWAGTWAAPGVQSAELDLNSSIEPETKSPLGQLRVTDLDGTSLGMLGTTHGHTSPSSL